MPQPATAAPPLGQTQSRRLLKLVIFSTALILVLGSLFLALQYRLLLVPASSFPLNEPITVTEGMSAREVADVFAAEGYVQSSFLLYFSLLWWNDPTAVKASTYAFSSPLSPRDLARELTTGHFSHDLISLTVREGERAEQIAVTASALLPDFDAETFLQLARPVEGRLFPDTYFVPENFTASDLFTLLTDTYRDRVTARFFTDSVINRSLTEDEVIILASILEREANSPESMRLVSGILQNRLDIGMALQVDASMEYVLNKPLKDLTPADLDIDSPYNTYLYPGLPPTPIGNPGLTAIEAVLEPTSSDYFYYITGNDGEFYYARTFDEHRVNIARHLR